MQLFSLRKLEVCDVPKFLSLVLILKSKTLKTAKLLLDSKFKSSCFTCWLKQMFFSNKLEFQTCHMVFNSILIIINGLCFKPNTINLFFIRIISSNLSYSLKTF